MIVLIILLIILFVFIYCDNKNDESENPLKYTNYSFLWLLNIDDLNREKYNSEEKIKLLREELRITNKHYLLAEISEEEKYLSYINDTLDYKRKKK